MAKSEFHRQCLLVKDRKDFKTTWIPEKFAEVGKVLKLKDDAGNWEDGWLVIKVYSRKPSKEVDAKSQEYKKHRHSTDI